MNEPEALIGRTVDNKYTILELLGRGAMGAVFKAEHRLMDRTVALKVLSLKNVDDGMDEFLRRFEREARTASKIRHPSAITIHDYGLDAIGNEQKTPYLVMEHIQGVTLKERMQQSDMTPEKMLQIIHQVCGALEEAHSLGIVHRDLKPDNIMISKRNDGSDWAHVLDFGIAKVLSSTTDTEQPAPQEQLDYADADLENYDPEMSVLTQAGMIIGTPRYMSPEQIRAQQLDGRTDIYALGIMLYEYLAGEGPIRADSFIELVSKRTNLDPTPLLEKSPTAGVSKKLERVIMKAISRNPSDRQESARQFSEELMEAHPVAMPGLGVAALSGAQLRKRPFAVLTVLILTAALTAGAIFYFRPMPEENVLAVKEIEQSAVDAKRRAAEAEQEAAQLNKKAAELELQLMAEQGEAKRRAKAEHDAREAEERARKAMEQLLQKEQELDRIKAAAAKTTSLTPNREKQLEKERKAAEQKLEEARRQVRAAEEQAKAAEQADQLSEEGKVEEETVPPGEANASADDNAATQVPPTEQQAAKPAAKRPRRRCGPGWCD